MLIERPRGAGTGIYVGNDRVLTAEHVVAGTTSLRVSFAGSVVGSGQVVKRDVPADLALLLVPGLDRAGARALRWGDSSALQPGDPLVVVGYPLGVGLTVTTGIVSGLKRLAAVALVQTDAAVNPGNSGGPLLISGSHGNAVLPEVFGSGPTGRTATRTVRLPSRARSGSRCSCSRTRRP
ncbi:MAG: trypsin-like peptidase domain-containing protein [Deltaproteobacteria bacterium]|nr:trypsin-like peptidase domain-containing protein [Deltaproteobacteria bacterium]